MLVSLSSYFMGAKVYNDFTGAKVYNDFMGAKVYNDLSLEARKIVNFSDFERKIYEHFNF